MPRSFDSDDSDPLLCFTENVECPRCGEIFEGQFLDRTASLSVQDMVEPPTGTHQCPACGQWFDSSLTGWTMFSDGS